MIRFTAPAMSTPKTVVLACVLASAGFPALHAESIRVTSTAQEVTVFAIGSQSPDGIVGGNPSGVPNGNCTLGEAILAVNRRQNLDACKVRSANGAELPFPATGPVTIELAPGATYTLVQWATTLYGPTGLPAIGAAVEGPAVAAPSEIIIEGHGAIIERSTASGTPTFRLFSVAGTVQVSPSEVVQARETNPLLTPAPGNLLSTGSLTLRNLWLRGGLAKGGDGWNGGLGAGGAIFNAGQLRIERAVLTGNWARGGQASGGRGGGGMGGDSDDGGGGMAGRGSVFLGGGTVSDFAMNGAILGFRAEFGGGGAGNTLGPENNGSFGGGGGYGRGNTGNVCRSGPCATGGFGGGAGRSAVGAAGVSGNYSSGFGAGGQSRFNVESSQSGSGLGGAIFSSGGVFVAEQVMFSGNNATVGGNGSSAGYAVFVRNGDNTLRHVTVLPHAVNGSAQRGTALYVIADDASATVRIQNSALLAEASDSAVFLDLHNTYPGGTPSIVQDNVAVVASAGGDVALQGVVADGGAMDLGYLGGLLPSAMPRAGSGLLNAGNAAAAAGLSTDMRGFPRVVGAAVDIGAVEREAQPNVSVVNLNDGGLGSLRDATAIASVQAADVRFQPGLTGTITQAGTLVLNGPVRVIGPGADRITVAGGAPVVSVPALSGSPLVELSGLTLAGGNQSGNPALAAAGLVNAGRLELVSVHLRDSAGRGLYNGVGASLRFRNGTVSGHALVAGVALQNDGTMDLANVTIAGNTVTIPIGSAGSVWNIAGASLTMTNVTIAANTGPGPGAGVVNSGTMVINNSIVSGNSGSQVNGSFTGANNLIGTASNLGALQNNGGAMPTILPGAGSNALDVGNNALIAAPTFLGPPFTDQRGIGFPRIVQGTVDIGAVERGCALAAISPATLPAAVVGRAYSQVLSSAGATGFVIQSGTLPAGITLANSGELSGTASSAGNFDFVAVANDAIGCTAARAYTLTSLSDLIFSDGF